MKVEAPRWSAWTAGRVPVNWGPGAGPCGEIPAALACLYRSTKVRISSLSWVRSVSAPSTRLKRAMMSRLMVAPPLGSGASASRPSISWYWLRRPLSNGSLISGSHSGQGEPLGRSEQLARVENDDRPARPGHDPGDIDSGEAAHHRAGRDNGRAVDPEYLPDLVHQHGHPLVTEVEDHGPGLLPDRCLELEALPEVHHRHRPAGVRHDALEERRRLGQRGRRLVAQDALDLQDVERELLGAQTEGHHLDVVGRVHADVVSEMRATKAVRSSSGTRPSGRRATAAANGRVDPGGTGCPGSFNTSSASSTSRQIGRASTRTRIVAAPRRPGPGVPAGQPPRGTWSAVEQGAEMDQWHDVLPGRGDAANRRFLRRDWIDRAGLEHFNHVGQREANPSRARPDQEPGPAHDTDPGLSFSVTSAAMRPTGTTWLAPPACRAALGIP